MTNDDKSAKTSGAVRNLGVFDLTGIKSSEDLKNIVSIENVGVILVPEHLQGALNAIPMANVGTTVTIPEGMTFKIMTGQIKLSGEALACASGQDTGLLLVGQIIITSNVEKIMYKQLICVGQLIAPKESDSVIGGALTKMIGQVLYYSGTPRIFVGEETFSKDFIDSIEEPMTMVLIGKFVFEKDITASLFKEKIKEILLCGKVRAPKALIPTLQMLATEKVGKFEELA